MLKYFKKILALIISFALTLGVCVFPISAQDTDENEVSPQNSITVLQTNFGNNTTKNTPDGDGLKVTISNKNNNSQNVTVFDNNIQVTGETLKDGAFIIWSGHQEKRTVGSGETLNTEDPAYIRSSFMFRFAAVDNSQDESAHDKSIGSNVPIYFISSQDGTVLRNDVNGNTKLAKNGETYYNGGWWIIPGSSLGISTTTSNKTEFLNDKISYKLTLVQYSATSMNSTCSAGVVATADLECYYDNLCWIDNIEDLLGTKNINTGTFVYDTGTTYPAYKLGYMSGDVDAPEVVSVGNKVTASGLADGTLLNAYKNGSFVSSSASEDGSAEISGLSTGIYTFQTVLNGDKYASVSSVTKSVAVSGFSFDTENQTGVHMIRNYTNLTLYDSVTGKGNGTTEVPDGQGFITHTENTLDITNSHDSEYRESLSSETVNNGALVFYFKYDAKRTVTGGEEDAYAYVIPSIGFVKENKTDTFSLKQGKTAYFISSEDGTVIKQTTQNSSLGLVKKSDGTCCRAGWWIIPLSQFTKNGDDKTLITDDYALQSIKYVCRNLNSNGGYSGDLKATCGFYLDNPSIVDDITDVLGEKNSSGSYIFDNDSVYPVYNLGVMDSVETAIKKEDYITRTKNSITFNTLSDYTTVKLNIYSNGKLVKSVYPGEKYTVTEFNNTRPRAQLICDEKVFPYAEIYLAGDINENGKNDLLDLILADELKENNGKAYNSDINGDALTNEDDLTLIKKMLIGVPIN